MQRVAEIRSTNRVGSVVVLTLLCLFATWSPSKAATEVVDGGIRFSYSDSRAREVALAGGFNNWSTTANVMTQGADGAWSVVVSLEPGEHEYKFVVDGQWIADPDNPATVGDYGNSGLSIGADGSLAEMKATSNTGLSPKILVGGRAIALYQYRKDDAQDRFELDRPNLDFDVDFDVRVNDDLDAHFLANINNEAENLEFFETRLNFDRGSLVLDNSDIFVQAWDNEGLVHSNDPLSLVGNVGIYDHAYGFGTAGARVRREFAGFVGELLYTDDSDTDSGFPGTDDDVLLASVYETVRFQDGRFQFQENTVSAYATTQANGGEDVLAAWLRRDLSDAIDQPLSVGALFRLDRGYRPGSLVFFDRDLTDSGRTQGQFTTVENSRERWLAGGGEASLEIGSEWKLEGEYLRGKSQLGDFSGVTTSDVELTTQIDGDTTAVLVQAESEAAALDEVDLDESQRVYLGLRMSKGWLGLDGGFSWEYQDHDLSPILTGLVENVENSMSILRLDLDRQWKSVPGLGVPGRAGLDCELFLFDYDQRSPWETQMWFDRANFWLEYDEHEVSYDRLTLLGGSDAFIWRPDLTLRVHEGKEVDLSYKGTLGSEGIGKTPKYFESLFQVRSRIVRDWGIYWDNRLVRYDVPVLGLEESFFSTFFEVAYEPVDGVSLAVSWGVDPYAIDGPVNEYDYIGRDLFLFGSGANATTARDDFLELGNAIRRGEELLEDENRVQFEARLEF